MNAGYSGTPLAKQLGIAAGSRVCPLFAPADYRELVLPLGWVDVRVCAVDAVWSGLKLVVRRELRGQARP